MDPKSKVKVQNERISKEIKMLKNLPPEMLSYLTTDPRSGTMLFGKIEKDYGTVIKIEIQSSLINSLFLKDIEKLNFEILLTKNFPLEAPQVYCNTKIGFPLIDDKRDVLGEVIHSEWNQNMTIYETIQLIPEFVSEVLLLTDQDEEVKDIGKWHLGQSYNMANVNAFRAREEIEIIESSNKKGKHESTERAGFKYLERLIIVCENSFYLFEPDLKQKDMAKLLSAATLCSLEKIVRNLDTPDLVTFMWRKLENQKDQWSLKVEVKKADNLISKIVKYLKSMEISSHKKYEKKRKILESEVNAKALKKTDVFILLKEISDAELEIKTHTTKTKAKHLMELYQKAIEYYSALDNKCFEDFLNRMTNLFKNEKIQRVLSQTDEEEKKEQEERNEKLKEQSNNSELGSQQPFQITDLLEDEN